MFSQTSTTIYHPKHRTWWHQQDCVICGSTAIGVNFGARTCAPCKAFFRRNARRKEIVQTPCPFQESSTSNLNTNDSHETNVYCSQIRYCSSCRLRRCFNMGMKEELVRTDKENERYRQLVETNRQRRNQLLQQDQFTIPRQILSKRVLLHETDWNDISNIVIAYETYCLKNYIQQRENIYHSQSQISDDDGSAKINHHASTTINKMTSFLLFLSTIPTVKLLPKSDRIFLCKHNIRPLILLNSHELDQLCYSEPWQLMYDNLSAKYVCGNDLFSELVNTKHRAEQILITDPVVTRLWLLILFFSTPLHCYYNNSLPEISLNQRIALVEIQHSYINLLWNYLSHRHGDIEVIRIFSNLTSVYLSMQRISQAINTIIRTRDDLSTLNESFDRAVVIDSDDK
ncbi:unnamed protein product [Adineta steineri]|uniref:Nuclear receptor domain-containing protein n=2 Tax=Adineta steineri TaxID=433720 RepID=A0A814NKA8_9BILA|nr:unnamed protein product [Adineta steineri]CAF3486766.1 unnamed protein product [Adineta steineri]